MTRIVHLDEHVSRVDSYALELLDSPNCNLLVLSDLQVSVLRQMTFPYVNWATRLVEDHESYQVAVDFPQAYSDELECLELLLSGGSEMTCDLSTVLADLADAIRNQPTGGGACPGSGSSVILNCLPGMLPGDLIPQPEAEAPEIGVPPEGFDTWAEYLTHKCKAAHAVYDTVHGLFGALALLPILQVTVTVIGTALAGYIGATAFGAAAYPPAAIVAIAAVALAIGLLDAAAYIQCKAIQTYLAAHEDVIICALYTSGSGSEALEALAGFTEDAIQSVEWSVIFGPALGPELAAAFGSLASQAQTNNLVNPLFRAIEGFAYPTVSCECGGSCTPEGLISFAEGLAGAVLYDESGGYGWLNWVDDPGRAAYGQNAGHADEDYSGFQFAADYSIAAGAHLALDITLATTVSMQVYFQADGDWIPVFGEDLGSGINNLDIDLAAYQDMWLTGIRVIGSRGNQEAWGAYTQDVDITCP